jgi:hypothetical protein
MKKAGDNLIPAFRNIKVFLTQATLPIIAGFLKIISYIPITLAPCGCYHPQEKSRKVRRMNNIRLRAGRNTLGESKEIYTQIQTLPLYSLRKTTGS